MGEGRERCGGFPISCRLTFKILGQPPAFDEILLVTLDFAFQGGYSHVE